MLTLIHEFGNRILPLLANLGSWGYWLAFVVAALETTIGVGPLVPGSTLILFLGALAARGHLELYPLLGCAILGAIAGDQINYRLGKKYGARWLAAGFWFLKARHLEQVRTFVEVHGPKSIFLGRFLPSGKEIVPFVAGVGQMAPKVFLLWNVLGALGWGLEWVGAGYLFGHSLNLAELWLSRAGFFLALLLLLLFLLSLLKRMLIAVGKEVGGFFYALWRSLVANFCDQPAVARWLAGHRGGLRWWAARGRRDRFAGLPLLSLLPVVVVFLGLVSGGGETLLGSEALLTVDRSLSNLFAAFRTELLTTGFTWITRLGDRETIGGLTALLLVGFRFFGQSPLALPLVFALVGSESFAALGKLMVQRPRPGLAVYLEPSFSFPSGHATLAVVFYGFLAYLAIRATESWSRKVNLFFVALLLVLAIGLSRLYLGAHYPSDVVGGYLLGGLWLLVALALAEWRRAVGPLPAPVVRRGARPIAFVLMGVAAIFIGLRASHPPRRQFSPALPPPVELSTPAAVFASEDLRYTETFLGERQEPLNFVFLAPDEPALVAAMARSGWQAVPATDFAALLQAVQAHFSAPTALAVPIAPTFWAARIQDFAYRRPLAPPRPGHDHRLRLWRTEFRTPEGERIYLGLANATEGLRWGVLPQLAPAIDAERGFLYRALLLSGAVEKAELKPLVAPYGGRNFIGARFVTDGQAYFVKIVATQSGEPPVRPPP